MKMFSRNGNLRLWVADYGNCVASFCWDNKDQFFMFTQNYALQLFSQRLRAVEKCENLVWSDRKERNGREPEC
jgi:hypothetical protein